MNKCYDPDGNICDVTHICGNKIHYITPIGGATWCSRMQQDQRINLYGPLPEPVVVGAPVGTYVEAAEALAMKKAPLADDVVRKPSHYQVFEGD